MQTVTLQAVFHQQNGGTYGGTATPPSISHAGQPEGNSLRGELSTGHLDALRWYRAHLAYVGLVLDTVF